MNTISPKTIERLGLYRRFLTVPAENAQEMSDLFVGAGIKGILNFTPTSVKTPEDVYVERIDLGITLEKTAYYTALYMQHSSPV